MMQSICAHGYEEVAGGSTGSIVDWPSKFKVRGKKGHQIMREDPQRKRLREKYSRSLKWDTPT
jgi:hypothetical protein